MVSKSYVISAVSKSFVGGLASKALFLMSEHATQMADKAEYTADAIAGLNTLQSWYNNKTGLWDSTGWWNSANCLTVLGDFASLGFYTQDGLNIPDVIQNTYEQAQKTHISAVKVLSAGMMPFSTYSQPEQVVKDPKNFKKRDGELARRGFDDFLNDYYDDEGWWALALIRAHDLGVLGMGDQEYLLAANDIFEDMKAGASPCGGIYWSKVTNYTNAIANELFLSVAASLANRMPNKPYYLDVAVKQWDWFQASGLINEDVLVNDGLTDACKNNGGKTWSYNQGVILGGLAELYRATQDNKYIETATSIALSAMDKLSVNGTLSDGCEPNCGKDGAQFKGVFIRNLRYLHEVAPQDAFRDYILHNADSIWKNARNDTTNQLGVDWHGPFSTPDAGTQSSALDALVAAVAVV